MLHILCFGNSLHGDDGFGMAVYETILPRLKDRPDVRVLPAATLGLSTLGWFASCQQAILVDALQFQQQAGRLHFFAERGLLQSGPSLALHGGDLRYLLQAVMISFPKPPQLYILGAEVVAAAPYQPGLSEPISRAVDEACAYLCDYVDSQL